MYLQETQHGDKRSRFCAEEIQPMSQWYSMPSILYSISTWYSIYPWFFTPPILSFYSFSWPPEIGSEMALVFLCFLTSLLVNPKDTTTQQHSFWRALTSMNKEKKEDISGVLHCKNLWDLCFFQPSEHPKSSASASLLSPVCFLVKISGIQLQVHFVPQLILLTLAHVTS